MSISLSNVSGGIVDFFSARNDREDVKAHCDELRIFGIQRDACMEVLASHGKRQAIETADRIAAQMRAIRTRYDTRPEPPEAA